MSRLKSKAWQSFIAEILDIKGELEGDGCDTIFYRGQNDSDWDLIPSLFRKKYSKDTEDILFYDFRVNSGRLLDRSYDTWEILFSMRHHNLPTRLLDWTESFAIALYFAVANANSNAAIWMLDPYELNQLSNNEKLIYTPRLDFKKDYLDSYLRGKDKLHKLPMALYPEKENMRVFAQKGTFTIHGASQEPLNILCPKLVKKVVIPCEVFSDAQTFLTLSGINQFSLFPDLDGLSRHLISKI